MILTLNSGTDFCVERLILAEPMVSTRRKPKMLHSAQSNDPPKEWGAPVQLTGRGTPSGDARLVEHLGERRIPLPQSNPIRTWSA
jgi:hypothetical protein